MKKRGLILSIVIMLLLSGCASEEDKAIAQEVISQIENLGTVTLDNAEEVYIVQSNYQALSDKQKNLVKSYQTLNDAIARLEELVLEEEIKNDPTNTISKSEMVGIWKEDTADSHIGYLYFDIKGYVYYVASKTTVTKSDFTNDYIISTSYELGDYNKNTREKDGSFYCLPSESDYDYSVTKDENGQLYMTVVGKTIEGTYTKTGNKIDVSP